MLKHLFFGAILCGLAAITVGYSGGAPGGTSPTTLVCTTMSPSHGSSGQNSPSPYTVTFSPANFIAGGTAVTVTLSGGIDFKGFLLRAEYSNNSAEFAGSFNTPALTQKTCGNTLVTHTTNVAKPSLVFSWTPPATSKGHIRFKATFVKDKSTYWVAVEPTSGLLLDSALPAPTTTTLAPGVTTTPALTAAPTIAAPVGTIKKDAECGKTKGCFSDCTTSSCSYLLTWERVPGDDSVVQITMKGIVGSETTRYISFGLSTDSKMASDSVNFCLDQGTTAVYASWNPAGSKSNTLLTDPQSGLSHITVQRVDGILTCTFKRLKAAANVPSDQRYALDGTYTIFWATGLGSAGGISQHDRFPVISAQAAALTDYTVDISGGNAAPQLVRAHGSLMLVAWVFAASIGIVMARYFKNVFEDKTLFSQKIWFQVHRACMVLVLLATVIAFIIIFVEADGYSQISGENYKKAHPILGIIVTALTVINPIMAIFRPHPNTPKRPIFNWAHWAVGTGAYVLGIITIFFGLSLEKSGAPEYAIYVMAAFVVWQGLVQLVLEIGQFISRNSGHREEYELTDVNGASKGSQHNPPTFYKVVLGSIHVLVVTGFVIALIIIFNVGKDDD